MATNSALVISQASSSSLIQGTPNSRQPENSISGEIPGFSRLNRPLPAGLWGDCRLRGVCSYPARQCVQVPASGAGVMSVKVTSAPSVTKTWAAEMPLSPRPGLLPSSLKTYYPLLSSQQINSNGMQFPQLDQPKDQADLPFTPSL